MSKVTIENRVRRPRVFMLEHDSYCDSAGKCLCTVQSVGVTVTNKKSGKSSIVFDKKKMPATITLLYRVPVQVESAVLSVPAFDAARRRGEVRVIG